MTSPRSRRTVVTESAALVSLCSAGTSAFGAHGAMKYPICVTCGMQIAQSEENRKHCPMCDDERQYVGHGGQTWTTLEEYGRTHKIVVTQEQQDLYSLHPEPKAGIGQRAFLVRTKAG